MKKINVNRLETLNGGISNRACTVLGMVALLCSVCEIWPGAAGATSVAAGSGCFGWVIGTFTDWQTMGRIKKIIS